MLQHWLPGFSNRACVSRSHCMRRAIGNVRSRSSRYATWATLHETSKTLVGDHRAARRARAIEPAPLGCDNVEGRVERHDVGHHLTEALRIAFDLDHARLHQFGQLLAL